jgi:hypothetical protein
LAERHKTETCEFSSRGVTVAAKFNNKPTEHTKHNNKEPAEATTGLTLKMMMASLLSAEAAMGKPQMHKRVKRATLTAVHNDGSADLCHDNITLP